MSEIAAGCKTAMRGGGCQWGMAEESGYAALWLAARGLFSPFAFAEVVKARPGLSPPQSAQELSPCAGYSAQCPICLGAFLSDHLEGLTKRGALSGGKPLLMRNVQSPLLTAACLPQAAKGGIVLSWRGGGIVINGNKRGAAFYGEVHKTFSPIVKLQSANAETLAKIKKANPKTWQTTNTPSRIPAADNNWQKLMQWAKKTMVAPSQTSTIKGAGAGLTDND